jgi:hypothetical protein
MTVDVDNPFGLPSDMQTSLRDQIITGGRYRLPNRDGSHKKGGWQRVSNLVSAYSDQFSLRMWEIEQVLKGVSLSPELFERVQTTVMSEEYAQMDRDERYKRVAGFVELAKDLAGGNEGSKYGSQRHAVAEVHHAGLPLEHFSADTRRHFSLYASAMKRNQLRAVEGMQERRVMVERFEVIGTLDNIVDDLRTEGVRRISDLKTAKKFWTWLEHAAQLAIYAHGDAMWEPDISRWVDMPPVDQEVGIIMWMPRCNPDGTPLAEPFVEVREIDLVAGWETAKLAHQIVRDRSAAKSTKNPRSWVRSAPMVTETEKFAARFAACETSQEGMALVAEAKRAGVWSPVLADEAKKARDRILVAP